MSQVLLLLQSSDRIAHDICDALPLCGGGRLDAAGAPELALVLRQWRALAPGREFRCFVAGGELVGDARWPSSEATRVGVILRLRDMVAELSVCAGLQWPGPP